MHTGITRGTGDTLPFRAGVLLLASAARRLFGVDVRAVGTRVASMATDPGLPGRLTTRYQSVTGIIRRAALRHLRYETGRPVFRLSRTCAKHPRRQRQPSRECLPGVPREANARTPRRACTINRSVRRVHRRTLEPGRTQIAAGQSPTAQKGRRTKSPRRTGHRRKPTSNGLLFDGSGAGKPRRTCTQRTCVAAAARSKNGLRTTTAKRKRPYRRRIMDGAHVLPTGDSYYLLTSTPKPYGHRFSGDLPGFRTPAL